MEIKHGEGKTQYGPGVSISMTGTEVALAIRAWLVSHNVHINGPATVTVNDELCACGEIYVDPSGVVVADGVLFSGRG